MATDYDAPRAGTEPEPAEANLQALQARESRAGSLGDDADPFEAELALPGSDLDASDLTMTVLPKQDNEFTCSACFLVHHRSQLADAGRGRCRDCAE